MTPEFSRLVRVQDIGTLARREAIVATAAERAALAVRFGLIDLDRLEATLEVVEGAGGITVTGSIAAVGTQPCAVSAEPVPFTIAEPIALLFGTVSDADEIELSTPDLDTLRLDGDTIDLGEAVAQSLGLALDPYPRAPAELRAAAARFLISEEEAAARAAADKAAANPFNVLRR